MLHQLRHFIDVLFGRVRLVRPVVCVNPHHTRARWTVSEFEAELLAKGISLGCTCGHGMRPAPHPSDTDLKTGVTVR